MAQRYRLAERLGAGGMGVVWRAYDERLHRKVAVKQLLLPQDAGSRTEEVKRRAMREGRIAARLQHPHSIAVFDVVEEDGQPYLIMEYLPSRSLAEVLAERGPLPVEEVARIGAQLAAALGSAHSAGVVHRDVKPGNVLLDSDGTVKITDFGISRAVEDATVTASGMVAGTPAYLSPEVAKGEPATYASDVYSLGATLYTALEGSPPFGTDDNPIALLHRIASGQVIPPTRSGRLTDVLTRMLDSDPASRPTMPEVEASLTAPVKHHSATARFPAATVSESPVREHAVPDSPPADNPVPDNAAVDNPVRDTPVREDPVREHPGGDEPPRTSRRRPALLIIAAILLLSLAGVALLLAQNREEPGSATGGPPGTAAPAQPPTQAPAQQPTQAPAQAPTAAAQPTGATGPAPGNQQPQTPPTARTPAETVVAYYGLMPANLDEGWTWLTPKYQRSPAGGREGYQRFWGGMRGVRVSDVNPTGDTSVEANVEYLRTDGHVVRERHRYQLINQNGRWMIDQSAVLSSVTT